MSNYTYMVTNKLNGKVYVGSHCWKGEGLDPNYYGSGTAITRAVKKYGKDNFQVEVLYFYDTVEECRADEERILTEYDVKNCPHSYNCKNGAVGFTSADVAGEKHPQYGKRGKDSHSYGRHFSDETRLKMSQSKKGEKHPMYGRTGEKHPKYGKKLSDETRKKMSESKKGEKHPMYGKHFSDETRKKMSQSTKGEKHPMYNKHHTDETKQKMSQAKKGRTLSEEHRKKLSESKKGENNPNYGKKLSDETRKKLSQANKGKTLSEEHRNKISLSKGGKPFVAIKNGKVKIFTSQMECARKLNLNQSKISKCLKGKLKSTGGYTFKYIEQLESGIYEGML